MMKLLTIFALTGQFVFSLSAFAGNSCDSPKPIFGKVIAICGDQMITYVGDQKLKIIGVQATQSAFELAYCEGGGRKSLFLQAHSEGYQFTSEIYENGKHQEKYEISRYGQDFQMVGTDYQGRPVNVKCAEFRDTRTNIEYIN